MATKKQSTKKAEKQAPKAAKEAKAKQSKAAKQPKLKKEKMLSALDAAAKVLAEAGEPLNCRQMIEQMAAKGLWTSPGGQTPWATLYSAILRELQQKGKDARFQKTERGKFSLAK